MTAAYQDSRGRKIQIVVIEAPASWYATTMKSWVLCSSLLAGATLALTPNVASACGGTFCDSGPTSMPVDQTGENILFVIDETHVEAHIQVQYDPDADADQFAWVIPVSVLPEFSVGSEALFQSLLSASVPRYGFNTTVDACEPVGDSGQGDGDGDGDPSGDGDGDPSGDGDGDPDPDPEIIFEGVVGAFEIAVLQGGTIAEIMQWLGDNGYQQDPNAEPILDSYLQEGFMFVALKLAMNTEVAAIHPIVLRYPGNEPCVPLRLTRIAAVEDMDVRVFMLGDARSAPSNYRHVLVNPLMIDWISFGGNYKEVVSMAVDAFAAEGNAFVTEYAGTSQIVNTSALANWAWNSAAFLELELTPENTMVVLQSQGLADCDGDVCTLRHPMLAPLLGEYLPVPANIDPALFYSCLSCFEGLIDLEAWDAAAFAADLDERIFEPGAHAVELIETWPYLTRMFTTISPNEMNVDPIFHENPDLPDVSNINFGARRLLCNGEGVFTLPDGRQVYLPNPNFWPTFDTQMPWEQAVQQVGMVGPGQLLSDRSETIEEVLSSWNALFGWPDGTGGDGDGDGTTDDPSSTDEGSACACSTSPSSAGALTAMFALLGLGFGVRRRDRSTS